MHRAKQTRHLVNSRACILLNRPHILLTTWHFPQNKAQILPIKRCLVKQTAHLRWNDWTTSMRCETKHALCISSRVKRTAYPAKPTTNTVSQTTPHLVKLTVRQQTVQVAASASRSSRSDKLTIRQQTVSANGSNCTTLKQTRQTNHKATNS